MKSKKYRQGIQAKKVYQIVPDTGKRIFRLQPVDRQAILRGFKGCKWRSAEQIKQQSTEL